MENTITVAVAGLGNRGRWTYAELLRRCPAMNARIVAVADPVPGRRAEAAAAFGLPESACWADAADMLAQPRLADVLFVCTQDRQHTAHALAGLEKGYHLLLEKPVSPFLADCRAIAAAAHAAGRQVAVCHVLRYTPFFGYIHDAIASGRIGEVVSIQQIENVAYWHQAHSFVRGNWRRQDETSPMILQKSCHDMDILLWLAGRHCRRVSSFGSLRHFRPEHAPEGSAARCCDCTVRGSCPYDAYKIYLTGEKTGILTGNDDWPCNVLAPSPTEASVRAAIESGPYGRCVYHCDNDVVDHQVVNLELDDGVTASFTMCGFTSAHGRTVKVMGTHGDIWGDMEQNIIRVNEFGKPEEAVDVTALAEDLSGHGGGDRRLLADFLNSVRQGKAGGLLTGIDASLESHYAALAAEHSRLHGGESVELAAFVHAAQP